MPWCPKCGDEFREGFSVCAKCNEMLVEQKSSVNKENKNAIQDICLLTSAQDIKQAEIIESLLSAYSIPVLKRHKGTGELMDIYMGMSVMGVDIYVPETNLEEARNIMLGNELEPLHFEEESILEDSSFNSEEEAESLDKLNESYDRKRRFRAWLILLLFVPGIVSMIIGVIIFIIQYFAV